MAARDDFERYYAEKIWALLPDVYKTEDGNQPQPGVLRAIVEVVASQAAVTRRSIDRLWEDQHIETADEWAVPYIGDLVGTRPLPELDVRARRVDVARTIFFRRRRGTPILLETLVREIGGWDVVLVEASRRLARTFHRLDRAPVRVGRVTQTPEGGVADLRNARASELQPGPFDEFSHTVDVRRQRGLDGWFNIRKLNVHLFRFESFPVIGSTPYLLSGAANPTYTFDPSGRDIPLFTASAPPETPTARGPIVTLDPNRREFPLSLHDPRGDQTTRCGPVAEWQVRQPIACRLLGNAEYVIRAQDLTTLQGLESPPSATESSILTKLVGRRFHSEAKLRSVLTGLGINFNPNPPLWYRDLIRVALTDDSGKKNLYRDQSGAEDRSNSVELGVIDQSDSAFVKIEHITSGDLGDLGCQPTPSDPGILTLIDPELGRFSWVGPPPKQRPPPVTLSMGVNLPMNHPPQPATTATIDAEDVSLFAAGGSGDSIIANGVNVFEGTSTTAFAVVANAGTAQIVLNLGVNTGAVWSVGNVQFPGGNSAAIVHGQVRTSGSANESAGQVTAPPTIEATTIQRLLTTITATFLGLLGDDFGIDSGAQTISPGAIVNIFVNGGELTINPGSYGDLIVNGGNVIMSAGAYTFTNVTFNPSATFSPTHGAAVLRINVQNALTFRADCATFSAENLRFSVFGTGGATIGASNSGVGNVFRGTVVAANGPLILDSGRTYLGAFFGLTFSVHDNATVRHTAFSAWEVGA